MAVYYTGARRARMGLRRANAPAAAAAGSSQVVSIPSGRAPDFSILDAKFRSTHLQDNLWLWNPRADDVKEDAKKKKMCLPPPRSGARGDAQPVGIMLYVCEPRTLSRSGGLLVVYVNPA